MLFFWMECWLLLGNPADMPPYCILETGQLRVRHCIETLHRCGSTVQQTTVLAGNSLLLVCLQTELCC